MTEQLNDELVQSIPKLARSCSSHLRQTQAADLQDENEATLTLPPCRQAAVNRFWMSLGLALATLICCQSISAASADPLSLAREWRITRVMSAPWLASNRSDALRSTWLGQRIFFNAESVDGPGVFHCDQAVIDKTHYGAEGLFQGNLPTPAVAAAQKLGIQRFPLSGVRLACSTGVFEFHSVDHETMLTSIDNRILTLSRSPGTLASDMSPEGIAQRFLEMHFDGDMGFSSDRTSAHRRWLTKRLDDAVVAYFGAPVFDDEAPTIDGDPFTDSQSYPTRFSVGKANVNGDQAEVPIRFSDAFTDRVIVYTLLREEGDWKLDDVRYDDGGILSNLLK